MYLCVQRKLAQCVRNSIVRHIQEGAVFFFYPFLIQASSDDDGVPVGVACARVCVATERLIMQIPCLQFMCNASYTQTYRRTHICMSVHVCNVLIECCARTLCHIHMEFNFEHESLSRLKGVAVGSGVGVAVGACLSFVVRSWN